MTLQPGSRHRNPVRMASNNSNTTHQPAEVYTFGSDLASGSAQFGLVSVAFYKPRVAGYKRYRSARSTQVLIQHATSLLLTINNAQVTRRNVKQALDIQREDAPKTNSVTLCENVSGI